MTNWPVLHGGNGKALNTGEEFLAGQECCGNNADWNFRARYKELIMQPYWNLNVDKLIPLQNIIADGGSAVRDNILKRQETYGVAFALILGCAVGVLAAIANRQGPADTCATETHDEYRMECWLHQFFAGMAVGTSIMVEMIVLNNIAFVSTTSTKHAAWTVDNYQWLFSAPVKFGIPLTLLPLCLAVAMSISVNMVALEGSYQYPPSLTVYVFLVITFLIMLVQAYGLDFVKRKRIAAEAKAHFPEVDFPDDCFSYPVERNPDQVPLMSEFNASSATEKTPDSEQAAGSEEAPVYE